MSSLYILDIGPLSDVHVANIFFQFIACLFTFSAIAFKKQFLKNKVKCTIIFLYGSYFFLYGSYLFLYMFFLMNLCIS